MASNGTKSPRGSKGPEEEDEDFKEQVEDLYHDEVIEAIQQEKEQEQVKKIVFREYFLINKF